MRLLDKTNRFIVATGVYLLSQCALANDALDAFKFHGFATLNYLYSTENNFFGESSDGSFKFYELGLNTQWNPTDRIKVVAQAIVRDAGSTDDGSFRLDYGFLEYKVSGSNKSFTGIRLGRVVNSLGFYNETRDVAATRPGTLLPQSIYFDVNRNLALSSDGISLFHEHFLEQGDFTFQFGIAEPRTRDPDLEPAIFGSARPGSLEGTASWMTRLMYEHDLGRIRLAFTAAELNMEYKPGTDPVIHNADFSFKPVILSAQYQTEKWQFTTEWGKRSSALTGLGTRPDVEITGTSYYLQASYRFTPQISALLRYDSLVWDDDDKKGEIFASNPFYPFPGHTRYAKDWTIGARWDINQNWLLNAEIHDIEGTGWLSLLENSDPWALEKNWRLFTITASVRF